MLEIYGYYKELAFVIYYIYNILENIQNKYINGNCIIVYNIICEKYDSIHDLYVTQCIFDIKILTFKTKNFIKYLIYMNNCKISDLTLINNNIIDNNKIIILRTIIFMDELNLINTLIVFNCGIIIHYNDHINHIYNYMGYRRNIKKIKNFEHLSDIEYI